VCGALQKYDNDMVCVVQGCSVYQQVAWMGLGWT